MVHSALPCVVVASFRPESVCVCACATSFIRPFPFLGNSVDLSGVGSVSALQLIRGDQSPVQPPVTTSHQQVADVCGQVEDPGRGSGDPGQTTKESASGDLWLAHLVTQDEGVGDDGPKWTLCGLDFSYLWSLVHVRSLALMTQNPLTEFGPD